RRCTRRHVPSSFSYKEETWPLCGARAGPAKHLGLPLRVYPDVLRSRLAEAKSGPRCFRVGDEPTPVWGTVW
ncbi:hypothetical protein, partial [Aneurinibacillus aneurinilyticus]|uniref:hypothetical protein n=1 Tax=Aneurinibacillus aneurinilyticus TaxID=1391 RepID=UPI002E1DA550|nr:hypothetical protein [Aneurinibacillus aneurinilyticus]